MQPEIGCLDTAICRPLTFDDKARADAGAFVLVFGLALELFYMIVFFWALALAQRLRGFAVDCLMRSYPCAHLV